MLKYFILMLLGAFVVVGGLGLAKFRQVKAAMAMGAHFALPPAAVTTIVVHQASWQPTVRAIGSLEAVQGVTVSADLPGIVKEILFDSGKPAKAGDILVRLVTDEEQAQLASAEAQRDLKLVSLKRQQDLLKSKSAAQSDYDTADAEYRQAEAALAQAKAVIDRKTIRAPFDGLLGIRQVNIGQYLNSGDKVVPLESIDPIYVDFTLPEQNLSTFGVGTSVQVHTDATGDTVFEGKITAINSQVDTATRNFQAQATVANPGGKLRSGMFANVDVLLADTSKVLPVPSSAISYAPYGNSVFVVTELKDADGHTLKDAQGNPLKGVSQHFVKLGQTRGDLVAVLSGIQEGDEVVSSGVFKLQNNAPIQINNTVQPGAEEAPNPEES